LSTPTRSAPSGLRNGSGGPKNAQLQRTGKQLALRPRNRFGQPAFPAESRSEPLKALRIVVELTQLRPCWESQDQILTSKSRGYSILLGGTVPHVNEALLKSHPL
jgi:hypothetical protein